MYKCEGTASVLCCRCCQPNLRGAPLWSACANQSLKEVRHAVLFPAAVQMLSTRSRDASIAASKRASWVTDYTGDRLDFCICWKQKQKEGERTPSDVLHHLHHVSVPRFRRPAVKSHPGRADPRYLGPRTVAHAA